MAKNTKIQVPEVQVGNIDLRLIYPDKDQPRKEFDDASIDELAADIKIHGIIQPITVREDFDMKCLAPKELVGKKCFKIVCGERRYRAACKLNMNEIPCMVRVLTDDEAFELQISENLQRKNINPMEESDAFQQLTTRGINTPEQIADRLGTSVRYIYDRLILQRVNKDIQDAVRDGRLSITHAKQFARIPSFDQAKLWEEVSDDETLTVAELRAQINDTFKLKLDSAPFDIKDAKLVKKAGACTKCTKRSGCMLVLFEEATQNDVCFDQECWNEKMHAGIASKIEQLKSEGKEVVLISTMYGSKNKELKPNEDWDEVEEETGIVGIVMERNGYDSYHIGHVINLAKEEEDNGHYDDREEKVTQTTKSGPSDYDYLQELAEDTIRNICGKYIANPNKFPAYDILQMVKDKVAYQFNYLEDEICSKVCEQLKITVQFDEDQDPQYRKSIMDFMDGMTINEVAKLLNLVDLLQEAESMTNHPDDDEFTEVNDKLKLIGIDMLPKLHSLETIAKRTLIDFTPQKQD
jgi:ParB/RepB/Spo0J family partition protein